MSTSKNYPSRKIGRPNRRGGDDTFFVEDQREIRKPCEKKPRKPRHRNGSR